MKNNLQNCFTLVANLIKEIIFLTGFIMLSACGGGGGGGGDSQNVSPIFTSGTAISVAENITITGYTAAATDADGDTVMFSLTGGTDQVKFSIDANSGVLSFNTAPDFEVPTDSDANNIYVVEITATDGINTVAQSVVVTVTNVKDTDTTPVFTSGIAISVGESITATGYTATATDADGDTLTYILTGGTDQSAFSIDSNSGVLSFNIVPDFEVPNDSDANNTYVVEITATDLINYVAQTVTVTVTDVILEVTVSTADIKTIQFDWSAYTGATHYKLFFNPDRASGFSLLQDNIVGTSTTLELAVHLTNWINASYILEAHDGTGKLTESSPFSITELMLSSIGYVKASNPGESDFFGWSVSVSADGNTLAVGAHQEDSGAIGISTDGTGEADNSATDSGAVYVFSRSGSTWIQQAYIKASNTETIDNFGRSVSLSADGNTLAVGATGEKSNFIGISTDGTGEADNSAPISGAVYVFSRSGSAWTQQAYVKASNTEAFDSFGRSVNLSADGNTLAVGTYNEKSGFSGISTDGTGEADNSTQNAGAVYIFIRINNAWIQLAYIKASNPEFNDYFGWSVSLSADGNTLAVGAYLEDSGATGISTDGTGEADNSLPFSGAVYVFSRSGSTWTQQAYIKASNTGIGDKFGNSVSLSADGNTLVVGAPDEDSSATGISYDGTGEADNSLIGVGAVYIFSRSGSTWTQQAYVKTSNVDPNNFGSRVSLSDDGNTMTVSVISRKLYVFSRSGNTWTQQINIIEGVDIFISSFSLSADGNTLAVGAYVEDSNATGIGGDQTDNSILNSGAVFLY